MKEKEKEGRERERERESEERKRRGRREERKRRGRREERKVNKNDGRSEQIMAKRVRDTERK